MNDKCLTRGLGNISDSDIFIRNNIHNYDAYIYGFQQDIILTSFVNMALKSNVDVKILFYLRSKYLINHTFALEDIKFSSKKFISFSSNINLKPYVKASSKKQLKLTSNNVLHSRVSLILSKKLRNIDEMKVIPTTITKTLNETISTSLKRDICINHNIDRINPTNVTLIQMVNEHHSNIKPRESIIVKTNIFNLSLAKTYNKHKLYVSQREINIAHKVKDIALSKVGYINVLNKHVAKGANRNRLITHCNNEVGINTTTLTKAYNEHISILMERSSNKITFPILNTVGIKTYNKHRAASLRRYINITYVHEKASYSNIITSTAFNRHITTCISRFKNVSHETEKNLVTNVAITAPSNEHISRSIRRDAESIKISAINSALTRTLAKHTSLGLLRYRNINNIINISTNKTALLKSLNKHHSASFVRHKEIKHDVDYVSTISTNVVRTFNKHSGQGVQLDNNIRHSLRETHILPIVFNTKINKHISTSVRRYTTLLDLNVKKLSLAKSINRHLTINYRRNITIISNVESPSLSKVSFTKVINKHISTSTIRRRHLNKEIDTVKFSKVAETRSINRYLTMVV